MTELLEKAFREVSKLTTSEQDAMAQWLLEELAFEQRWEKAFSTSQNVLGQLAEEALAEHRAGRTQVLNPDDL